MEGAQASWDEDEQAQRMGVWVQKGAEHLEGKPVVNSTGPALPTPSGQAMSLFSGSSLGKPHSNQALLPLSWSGHP